MSNRIDRVDFSREYELLVLGGGNAKQLNKLPKGIELGHNRNAFLGGVRLWQTDSRTRRPKWEIL